MVSSPSAQPMAQPAAAAKRGSKFSLMLVQIGPFFLESIRPNNYNINQQKTI